LLSKGLLFAGMKFARVVLNLTTLVSKGEATRMFHFNRQKKNAFRRIFQPACATRRQLATVVVGCGN
jgi:hypothetical protein